MLSSSIPYALLYIWDADKTQYEQKWVTGWLKDGIAYYEEQFPGQLKASYEGVRGYIYSTLPDNNMKSVQRREKMFYSPTAVNVYRVTEIPDVYAELMRYEQVGLFRLQRFEDASEEKQTELIDRIAEYITREQLHNLDNDHSRFMERYFTQAWEKAMSKGTRDD